MNFDFFAKILIKKFHHCSRTNEDTIRFLFYYSFIKQNPDMLYRIELENLHDGIVGAKVDMCINYDNVPHFFEFKYIRRNQGGTNQPVTQHAASLIKDILRLKIKKRESEKAYFIFITDIELHKHLIKSSNRYNEFYKIDKTENFIFTIDFFENRTLTFYKKLNKLHEVSSEFSIKCSEKVDLKNKDGDEVYLRIYEII